MGEHFVLDSSALLAMLGREPGGDAVASIISATLISAVNWSEVLQKARARGVDIGGLGDDLKSLGLQVEPFTADDAAAAAEIWQLGGQRLALADRACLATARTRGLEAVTADRAWASLELGIKVRTIR